MKGGNSREERSRRETKMRYIHVIVGGVEVEDLAHGLHEDAVNLLANACLLLQGRHTCGHHRVAQFFMCVYDLREELLMLGCASG